MDAYDRKKAGMIGALLFALGIILTMCMMFQLQQYMQCHVRFSGSGVLAVSTVNLFLVIIGFVLLSQEYKNNNKTRD
jgi:surface polysaccharide O-acyltransferase-like enzyme